MEAPPGGPVDAIRPYVQAVSPAPDSLNVGRDLRVQIAFSEWVAADAENGKVYLNPPVRTPLKSKLSGNLLEVTAKSPLDTGTTYLLGVLGSVKDLNGLPLDSPLELVFSTGSQLDSGRVSGRLATFQGKPSPGGMVALYPRSVTLRSRFLHLTQRSDSVVIPDPQPNPATEKPAYLAPTDSLGRFSLRAVRPGRYGLLGFQDINANLRPEVGTEALAIGPTVEVSPGGDVKTLTLFAYDTVPLKLMEAKWVGESKRGPTVDGTVHLKFSRNPHPLLAQVRANYVLRKAGPAGALDSGTQIPVLEVCVHPVSGEVELHTPPLEMDSQYVAYCPGLKDPYGNDLDTARSRASFRVTGEMDTTKANFIFFGPRKTNGDPETIGPERLMPERGMAIYYPRLQTDSLLADFKARLIVKLDTTPVPVTLSRANHHEMAIQFPNFPLKGQSLQFSLNAPPDRTVPIKDSVSSKDSLPVKPASPPAPLTLAAFTLADSAKLGSLKLKQESSGIGSRLVLRSLSSPAEFTRLTPGTNDFVWDRLPEGWYALDYFRDANGDGIWNPGSLSPWRVEEAYVQWMDSVEVKIGTPATPPKDSATASRSLSEKKLAWPPVW